MDLEIAKAVKHSAHWKHIQEELDRWKMDAFETMKNCSSERLLGLQAEVKAYEKMKALPQIVIDREQ